MDTQVRMSLSEAEKALIGTLIRWPDKLDRLTQIRANDFSERLYREIYATLHEMRAAGTEIDMITLDARMEARLGRSVSVELIECTQAAPYSTAYEAYAEIVLEASERRRIAAIGRRLIERSEETESDIQALLSGAQTALGQVHSVRSDWVEMSDVLIEAYEDIEARANGSITPCVSGLSTLDERTGGFFPGELTIIGARPSVGKTAFGVSIAVASALRGHKVCVVSAEMIASQVGQRLLSDAAQVNGMRLRAPQYIQSEDWDALAKGLSEWGQLPMSFLFQRNVEDICAQIRSQHAKGLCDMVVVDYMQLLTTREKIKDDWLRVGHISQMLKALTTDLKIPVIGLAQVARQNGVATVPRLDSLRGSGNLEQDADNVILLHRVESKSDDALTEDERAAYDSCIARGYNVMVLNVAKQRQGRVGLITALFDPRFMRFTPMRTA